MSNLKELAENAADPLALKPEVRGHRVRQLQEACTPAAILALIAENEALRAAMAIIVAETGWKNEGKSNGKSE